MADMSLDEALGLTGAEAADDSIHIDVNTRQVTVPESQQLFGVESDENVEVKHIVLDGRYNDGTDLSTLTLRVNWRNANGGKGSYLVTNLDVTEDSIAFDWVISRGVVAYKGTVYFIVCAFKVNSTGKTEQEWNSSLGQGSVLEGLEVTDEDIGGDDTVNRMLTILQQMNSVQTAAKNSADAAAASSKSASDTAGSIKNFLDQIASNAAAVSQLKEATAKLKDGKISKFYASSQGNTNLPDSDDGRIMDLKLYGKSEQTQYSGKNLFPPVTYSGNVSNLQIDAADGAVHLKGTPNDQVNSAIVGAWSASSPTIFTLPAGTYTLSGFGEWLATPRLNLVYVENGELISLSGNKTVTFDKETNFIAVFVYANANAALDITFKPMIEKGSTATDYEPYVGGIPSPNPEYPQEIKSVVKPSVKVCGKNLLNPDMFKTESNTSHGVTCKLVTDETGTYFLLDGTADATIDFWVSKRRLVYDGSANKLTISVREACPNSYYLCVTNVNNDFKGKTAMTTSLKEFSFYIHVLNGAVINNYRIYIQVEAGETATAYEPYTEQTVTLPYTLNAIPVSSGGNVTIDGQQYIADYVDVERGKLVRMVHEVSIADTLTFAFEGKTSSGYYRYNISDSVPNNNKYNANLFPPNSYEGWGQKAKASCTGFKDISTSDSSKFDESGDLMGIFIEASRGVVFQSAYTIDELKAKFPMQLLYAPKTHTETDLTADEIAAFKALVSHYPVTNVSTTSDQLDGYTVFNYPISLAKGYDYIKQQLGDTRDYLYGIDLMTAEAYVNSEYAAALAEIEV